MRETRKLSLQLPTNAGAWSNQPTWRLLFRLRNINCLDSLRIGLYLYLCILQSLYYVVLFTYGWSNLAWREIVILSLSHFDFMAEKLRAIGAGHTQLKMKVQFPMSHRKRKSIPVTIKIESQPRAPTKMGRYGWLLYYCNGFTFTVRHRELNYE